MKMSRDFMLIGVNEVRTWVKVYYKVLIYQFNQSNEMDLFIFLIVWYVKTKCN